jgi:hypothetical protein
MEGMHFQPQASSLRDRDDQKCLENLIEKVRWTSLQLAGMFGLREQVIHYLPCPLNCDDDDAVGIIGALPTLPHATTASVHQGH